MAIAPKSVAACLMRVAVCIFLCVLLANMAEGSAACGKSTLRVKVTTIHASPMAWAGIIAWTQEIDVQVIRSQIPEIKPRDMLQIGILLLKGDALLEENTPQLSSRKIAVGKVLELSIPSDQLKPSAAQKIIIEPRCVKVVD